jgi:ABC transport system ATP-binding/permease protein
MRTMCCPSMGVVPDDPAGSPGAAVWYSGSAHTFAAGKDVVIGRDIHADLRIADPLILGAHLVLRFDEDHSVAVDNDSRNGMFVKGRQVATVEVEDGQNIDVGGLVVPLSIWSAARKLLGRPTGVGLGEVGLTGCG